MPIGEHPIVVLKEQTPDNEMLVHPLANLQVSQKVVPLEFELSRFGNTAPEGERNFKLGVKGAAVEETVYDMFAPAQFQDMNDDEKLSAPAFESHKSGKRFTLSGYECGEAVVESNMQYEEPSALIGKSANNVQPISTPSLLDATKSYTLSTAVLEQVAPFGAAGLTLLKQTGKAKYRNPTLDGELASGFKVKPRRFIVIGEDGSIDNYESFAAATDALQKLKADDFAGNTRILSIVPYLGEVA